MSIIRTVIRMTAVGAIRSAYTWAQDRVYDSDNTPLADALKGMDVPKPYIVVYTDTDNKLDINGVDVYSVKRNLSLTVEIAVASGIKTIEGVTTIDLPHTDAAMELILDIVEGQTFTALFGDVHNEWCELLKRLVVNVERIPSERGGRAVQGVRWAARRSTFVLDTMDDFPMGVVSEDGYVVNDFIALARTLPDNNDLHHAANVIDLVINKTAYPTWEQAQAWLGLTLAGIRATGIAPLADLPGVAIDGEPGVSIVDNQVEPPLTTEIVVQQEDKVGDDLKVDPE